MRESFVLQLTRPLKLMERSLGGGVKSKQLNVEDRCWVRGARWTPRRRGGVMWEWEDGGSVGGGRDVDWGGEAGNLGRNLNIDPLI